MRYNEMSDSELAEIMVNYIGRVENLQNIIGRYLDGNGSIPSERIKKEYKNLKEELRQDAHEVSLKKNNQGSSLYVGTFVPSIREAATWGFDVHSNNEVNDKMYRAVEEALYKLTKHYSREEWGSFM